MKYIEEVKIEEVKELICCPHIEKATCCGDWHNIAYLPMGFAFRTLKDCMYMWAIAIRDEVIVGSTWDELKSLIAMIHKIDSTHKYVIYNYEFGAVAYHYFRGECTITKDFVRGKKVDKDGKPLSKFDEFWPDAVYAVVDDTLLFLDSEQLAPLSLVDLADAYCDTKVDKQKDEVEQCIDEAIIQAEFSKHYIMHFLQYKHLPATQNQIIKDAVSAEFDKNAKQNREIIKDLFPDKSLYILVRYFGFRGGFVLSSDKDTTEDVMCFDLESAYTASAVHGKFPMSKYQRTPSRLFRSFVYSPKYCTQLNVTFINLRPKEKWISIEGCDRCMKLKAQLHQIEVTKNSKILEAPEFNTSLCEIDFMLYEKIYDWDKLIVHECWIAEAGHLPDYAIKTFLKYYGIKSKLKLEGKKGTPEYLRAKTMPSTIFGFSCQKTIDDDDMKGLTKAQWHERFKYNKMMPQWGVYITANVRKWLVNAVLEVGAHDWQYSDTDSMFNTVNEHTRAVVKAFNAKMKERNLKVCDKYGLDSALYMTLGCFDDEGTVYDRFKTIGQKAYLAHKKGTPIEPKFNEKGEVINYKLTLAGIPECNFWLSYAAWTNIKENNKKTPFDYFTEDSPIIYFRRTRKLVFNVKEEIKGEKLYATIGVHEEQKPIKTTIRYANKMDSINFALRQMGKDLI